MKNSFHSEILDCIKVNSGTGTSHTFSDSYLGNDHPRYAITAPVLRKIAREWMREHRNLSAPEFCDLLTSLIEGESSTEKQIAGMLLDYSTIQQRTFPPAVFDHWLDHLVGWAEVDAVCTGDYTVTQLYKDWKRWKPWLIKFSKSKNIQKRRASLVLFCSVLRHVKDESMVEVALENVDRLKAEKDILITKAISWVLRSMDKHYKKILIEYLNANKESLPKIAVRETMIKLQTGKKTIRKTTD